MRFTFNVNSDLSPQNGSYGQHVCVPKIICISMMEMYICNKKFIFSILLLLLLLVQFRTLHLKNSSNLKLCTQVGFHDGLCIHMLNFSYIV